MEQYVAYIQRNKSRQNNYETKHKGRKIKDEQKRAHSRRQPTNRLANSKSHCSLVFTGKMYNQKMHKPQNRRKIVLDL